MFFSHKKGICDVTTNGQNEDVISPENEKNISMKGNVNPAYLLHFESPNEKYSRPPSASSSMRYLSTTNDLSGLYNQQHIDKLFSVKKHD